MSVGGLSIGMPGLSHIVCSFRGRGLAVAVQLAELSKDNKADIPNYRLRE